MLALEDNSRLLTEDGAGFLLELPFLAASGSSTTPACNGVISQGPSTSQSTAEVVTTLDPADLVNSQTWIDRVLEMSRDGGSWVEVAKMTFKATDGVPGGGQISNLPGLRYWCEVNNGAAPGTVQFRSVVRNLGPNQIACECLTRAY